jgi:hypothetical protein
LLGRQALDGAVADVAAELGAVEADALQHLVGVLLRRLHRVGQRGDAQHAAAGGEVCRRCAAVPAWNTIGVVGVFAAGR